MIKFKKETTRERQQKYSRTLAVGMIIVFFRCLFVAAVKNFHFLSISCKEKSFKDIGIIKKVSSNFDLLKVDDNVLFLFSSDGERNLSMNSWFIQG